MSAPVKEINIISVVSKKPLSVLGQSNDDGALIIQDSSGSGRSHQKWRLVPLKSKNGQAGKKIEEDEYQIENVSSGKVLDAKDGTKGTPIVQNGDSGGANQRWRIVPIEGETNQYRIESVSSGSVLDLTNSWKEDGTQITLRKYHGAASQRWQFMPSRRADRKMQWTPRSRWDGRQHWKLVPSSTLQPKPDAKPSFSDMKLVFNEFGYNEEAGKCRVDRHLRFLVDTTGDGRVDIVGFGNDGVWVALGQGDGTFAQSNKVLDDFAVDQAWSVAKNPRFLVDTTGDGRVDIVGFGNDGVWVALGQGDGTFAQSNKVLDDFAVDQAWSVAKNPRFLVDTTGDGRVDIVGFGGTGVSAALQDDDGNFAEAEQVVRQFGSSQRWRVEKHPRFLVDTTGDGRVDIVGCFDDGVYVTLQDDNGKFAKANEPVIKQFGSDQGWTSAKEHPRFLVKTTSDGHVADILGFDPEGVGVSRGVKATRDGQVDTTGDGRVDVDIVGFGPEGVWMSRGDSQGGFAEAKLVLNDFGSDQGWTGEKHLRFLADTTGDGRVDIVGFGDEGVWVSRGQGGDEFGEAELVCGGFGYNKKAGGWRVDRHPRFLADTTGDGRVDIIGFGGPGVYVARNLARQFVSR
jgi:Ricin-type beta-trefoil lectin domain-like